MELATAKAVITGGASGLGFATAQRVIGAGGQVVLLDINEEQGQASAEQLGDRAAFLQTDVADEASVKDARRFPDEPGNWSYYSFTTKNHKGLKKTAKAFPTATCASCHLTAPTDMVFSQYYPVLTAEKNTR